MRHHLTLTLILLCCVLPARSQLRPFGDAHAIVGARIEIGDGRVIEKGTVLIRDGLIEAVGKDLAVPPDAEVLKGEGLIVYPGFIDAWSTKGLKLPDWRPNQDTPPDTGAEASPSMREANRKYVRPELRAVEYFNLPDADAAPLRKAGFAAMLSAPSGGLINGTAVLVGLSGLPKRDAVLRAQAAVCLSLKPKSSGGFFGGGGYPATLLGYTSHVRQALLDARRYHEQEAAFKAGGPRRPPADDVLAALQLLMAGETPVLIEAETENEVVRALHLADEFGMKPIVCGGLEAWKHAATLAKRGVPVIVGLKFADEPKLPGDKPKEDKPKDEKPKGDDKPREGAKPGDAAKPDEKKEPAEDPDADLPLPGRREKKRLWEEKAANARKLAEAGVAIAFTTRGTKDTNEFWANLRRIVKEGFPRAAALKALTFQPAKLFGVERLIGTVEAGKVANLTVMTEDFLAEKTKARYIFVDGHKYDTEVEPSPGKPAGPPSGEDNRGGAGR